MPRIKRSVHARKKRRKVLEQARGYVGQPHVSYRKAKEAVIKADVHAYRDRKKKKRVFRRLWIVRINAAAREHGVSYSVLMNGLNAAGVTLDRKSLAELAAREPEVFGALVEKAKAAIPAA
jgi:large subunit ribosomal protein L20